LLLLFSLPYHLMEKLLIHAPRFMRGLGARGATAKWPQHLGVVIVKASVVFNVDCPWAR